MPIVGTRQPRNNNNLPEFGRPSGQVLCSCSREDVDRVDIDSLMDVMLANRQNSPDLRVMDKIKSGEIGPNSTYVDPLKANIENPSQILQEKLLRDMKMAKQIQEQQNQLKADMVNSDKHEAIEMSNAVTEDTSVHGLGENVPINVERNNTQENGAVFPETQTVVDQTTNNNTEQAQVVSETTIEEPATVQFKPINTNVDNSNIPDDLKGLLGKLKNSINKEIDHFNKGEERNGTPLIESGKSVMG